MQPSLEYFICIAKHNNISRAAEELHITQQSLSSYLKRLEDHYGLPLFNRKPVMSLTPFGQSVFDRACVIDSVHKEIESVRLYHQDRTSIRVGFSVMHIYRAMNLFDIPRFQAIFHNAVFRFRHAGLDSLAQMLSRGELDFYYTSFMLSPKYPSVDMERTEDVISKDVATFDFKAVVSSDLLSAYYGSDAPALIEQWKTGVTLKELSHMPLVLLRQLRNPIYADANEQKFPIHLRADCDNVHLVMEMVTLGMGFSIVPNYSDYNCRSSLLQFPITDPEELSTQSIVCRTTDNALKRPFIKELWNML